MELSMENEMEIGVICGVEDLKLCLNKEATW